MPSPAITSTQALQRILLWLQGICLLPRHIPAASQTWDYDTISLPRAPNPQGLVSYLAYWLQPLRGKTDPAGTLVHSLQLLYIGFCFLIQLWVFILMANSSCSFQVGESVPLHCELILKVLDKTANLSLSPLDSGLTEQLVTTEVVGRTSKSWV